MNQDGIFAFPDLPIDAYSVEVSNQGFASQEREGISLLTRQSLDLKFELKVGSANQAVERTEGAPLIQTESSSIQTSVNEKQMQDLPLNGRNALQLTTLITRLPLYNRFFDSVPTFRTEPGIDYDADCLRDIRQFFSRPGHHYQPDQRSSLPRENHTHQTFQSNFSGGSERFGPAAEQRHAIYLRSEPEPRRYTILVMVDHVFSEKNRLSVRYFYDEDNFQSPFNAAFPFFPASG